ncbi:IS256 family transposase [Paenibacillus alginolyticus]|uniref:IS256 family transposase n=1 Tax=Paenibacillus alginolyticus TaxID=59839 RepID=UPI00042730AC|nr:IS256 family transposase [Paenibacillus alginolyticus]MCY9669552.1 IS256 family transposase [Paenibacillus alginolyticus]
MNEAYEKVVKELAKDCRSVEDIQTKLRDLFKDTIQQVFEAEIDDHLGYKKHSNTGDGMGNSRNGYSKKTVKTKFGPTELDVPRDPKGEFEPQIIKKYETTSNSIEDQIVALYAKGMTTRDIESHMNDLYGIEVSPTLVSKVTDKIMPLVSEWQSRTLDSVYPIVFLDAIHFKVRQDSRIISKAAYSVLGINLSGHKDILGIWIGENESASFWLNVCTELKNRGVSDILIACKDGLSGFSEAAASVFPKTQIQSCVIHQIRNTLKYVAKKDQAAIMADLKPVYQALTLEEAELAFLIFKENWEKKYPIVIRSWQNNWDELTSYFRYPAEIRKIVYTTNTIEGYHRQLRKVTKTKTAYPTDDALRKIIYLATVEVMKKWGHSVLNWNLCLTQLAILFPERVPLDLPL